MITCSRFLQGQRRSSDAGGSRNLERNSKDPKKQN